MFYCPCGVVAILQGSNSSCWGTAAFVADTPKRNHHRICAIMVVVWKRVHISVRPTSLCGLVLR